MAKYIKLFNNHQEYDDFTKTCAYVHPNVSKCLTEGDIHYDEWHVGDILYSDGTVDRCIIEGKTPVGVLVIPANCTDDNTYRFMGLDVGGNEDGSGFIFDITGENRLYPIASRNTYPQIDENGNFAQWGGTSGSLASKGEPTPDQGYTYDFYAGNWYHHSDSEPKPYAPSPFLLDGVTPNPLYRKEYDGDNNKVSILSDLNGYENTQILYEFDSENLLPVKYCKEYAPGFMDGEWYLPTVGEWGYFWYGKVGNLVPQYRKALRAAGKQLHGLAEMWASTQSSLSTMVTYYNTNIDGKFGTHTKTTTHMSTVPFLKIKKEN